MEEVIRRARQIKLLALDVDGVLTDGTLVFGREGDAFKLFHARDGMGVSLLRRMGVAVALVTGRYSDMVRMRAEELKLDAVCQGRQDKGTAIHELMAQFQLNAEQIAYIGDDLIDLPALTQVGLACAVSDAVPEVKERVHFVTGAPGGRGAVREVAELILKAQGKWDLIIENYLEQGQGDRQ